MRVGTSGKHREHLRYRVRNVGSHSVDSGLPPRLLRLPEGFLSVAKELLRSTKSLRSGESCDRAGPSQCACNGFRDTDLTGSHARYNRIPEFQGEVAVFLLCDPIVQKGNRVVALSTFDLVVEVALEITDAEKSDISGTQVFGYLGRRCLPHHVKAFDGVRLLLRRSVRGVDVRDDLVLLSEEASRIDDQFPGRKLPDVVLVLFSPRVRTGGVLQNTWTILRTNPRGVEFGFHCGELIRNRRSLRRFDVLEHSERVVPHGVELRPDRGFSIGFLGKLNRLVDVAIGVPQRRRQCVPGIGQLIQVALYRLIQTGVLSGDPLRRGSCTEVFRRDIPVRGFVLDWSRSFLGS